MMSTSPLAWIGTLILPLSKPAPLAFGLGNMKLCPLVLPCLRHATEHPLTQQMVLCMPRGDTLRSASLSEAWSQGRGEWKGGPAPRLICSLT